MKNKKTNEKTGEGVWYFEKQSEDGEKLNRIGISYNFEFKLTWNNEKKEYIRTNEIEGYTVEIDFADLRKSKLTNEGY